MTNSPLKDVNVTVHYDKPDTSSGNYTNTYSGVTNQHELTNPTGTSYSNHHKIVGEAAQDADLSNSVLIENNTTSVEVNLSGGTSSSRNYVYVDVLGGALYNDGDIASITGAFVNNSIAKTVNEEGYYDSGSVYSYGGALYNAGKITSINADFINNSSGASSSYGGAIYNAEGAEIGSINGYFEGNEARIGSAIANEGTISTINGTFINNKNYTIYNNGNIEQIAGTYVNNGTAIYSTGGQISSIDGDFIKNSTAIYASGRINSINGNFINNGTAISSSASIDRLSGTFINNTNGAISLSSGAIDRLTADFIGNNSYKGGAIEISSNASVLSIVGDFIGNSSSEGGAIYNDGSIDLITGDFINNTASEYGGAIYNYVDNIELSEILNVNFIGNHANIAGGAIYNGPWRAYIVDIKGNFIGNSSDDYGGAIANDIEAKLGDNNTVLQAEIESIEANFIGNHAKTRGGAIFNDGYNTYVGDIKGDFIGNYVDGDNAKGGAIYNTTAWDEYRGYVNGIIREISGTFKDNYAKAETGDAKGGAIYNNGSISTYKNVSFIDNYAEAIDGEAKGGALYSADNATIVADGYDSLISGNYVKDANGTRSNAIYMAPDEEVTTEYDKPVYKETHASTLSLQAKNNGTITIDDKISGIGAIGGTTKGDVPITDQKFENYKVKFAGDDTGVIYLNNNIEADDYEDKTTGEVTEGRADVSLSDVTLHLGQRDDVLNNNNLVLNSGALNMINNQTGIAALNDFVVNGDTKFYADVDLANETMDRFTANSYGSHQGNLIVSGMNLISDAPEDRPVTEIYFAEQGLKDNVINGVSNGTGDLPDSTQTTLYTPIYKYNAVYDNRDDAGYFVFTKGDKIFYPTPGGDGTTGNIGSTGNSSDAFNPSVLVSPVTNQAASQATMTEAFKYVFEHADAFTQLPAMDRMAYIKQNMYALSTDYNSNLGTLSPEFNNKAGWVRPYVTLENMHLDNGPTVDATTYGTLIGFDTDFQDLKHGWVGMTTGYIGYNGSQLSYDGVDASSNGGLLGATQTFYKGNFWTAITGSVGASVGEAHTMYGSENYTSLLAGVASKTGYNFEFKEGRYIIQPIMYISYTFANTFDYTNAAGVKIENDPMHTIQLHPQVRFIMNTKNNWQPYIAAGVVWNPFTSGRSRANGIVLPEMSIKPYAEYGVGLQKRWSDKFTAFGQAMVRSGGRNGVALTFGFRWNIGKDKAKDTNEQVYNAPKKVIKKASR